MSRILNEKIQLNVENLKDFFDRRSEKYSEENPYTSIMYQDNIPELAFKRNEMEKDRVFKLMDFDNESTVLDIGCGVGRWADPTSNYVANYYGTDFSDELIKIAQENYKSANNVDFYCCDFNETSVLMEQKNLNFNQLIICGVFPYINDNDLEKGLNDLLPLLRSKSVIYIKTPVAEKYRLTLNEFWSEELKAHYSAIYRTLDEYRELINKYFISQGFQMIVDEELGNGELRNRKETWQHIFVLKRGK